MTQPLNLAGVTAQSLFDDNFSELKLSWIAGLEGADKSFDPEAVKLASSSSDLVGHLNLIHPDRMQVFGVPEINYYEKLDSENRKRQLAGLISLKPPCLMWLMAANLMMTLFYIANAHQRHYLNHQPLQQQSLIDCAPI